MFLMIFPAFQEGRWVSMNFLDILSFTADLVGLLSDLKDFLPSDSDSNATVGVVFVGFLRKKGKNPNLGN